MEDAAKLKRYEGICRFCGQVSEQMAKSQEDADYQASLNCGCADSKEFKHLKGVEQMIEDNCERPPEESKFASMSVDQVCALKTIGAGVVYGYIDKATITLADSRCQFKRTKDGDVIFTRDKSIALYGMA